MSSVELSSNELFLLCSAPGYNTNAGPYLGSSQSAPVAAMPYNDPSKGVSEPAYLPAQQWAPSSTQTGVQRKPAPSFGSSSSGPALSGYGGSSLTNSPASSTQPGAAFQPASGGNKSMSCGSRSVISSSWLIDYSWIQILEHGFVGTCYSFSLYSSSQTSTGLLHLPVSLLWVRCQWALMALAPVDLRM